MVGIAVGYTREVPEEVKEYARQNEDSILEILVDRARGIKELEVTLPTWKKRFKVHPTYGSLVHKIITTHRNYNLGSGLALGSDENTEVRRGVRVTIGTGDNTSKDLGRNGEVYSMSAYKMAADWETNPRAFGERLDQILKLTNRKAIENYLKEVGELVAEEDDEDGAITEYRFMRLSQEQPYLGLGKLITPKLDINKANEIVVRIAKKLSEIKGIRNPQIKYETSLTHRRFANSEGTVITDSSFAGHWQISAEQIRTNDGRVIDQYACGAQIFTREEDFINEASIDKLFDGFTTAIDELKRSKRMVRGKKKALLLSSAAMTLVHEYFIGHMASADLADREGKPLDRIGTVLFPSFPHLSLHVDPTINGWAGSYEFDEEGVPGRRITIVSNGVIKEYLQSRTSAGKRKDEETYSSGCARAGGWNEEEIREGNTILETLDDKAVTDEELEARLIDSLGENETAYIISSGGGEVDENGFFELTDLDIWEINKKGERWRVTGGILRSNASDIADRLIAVGESKRNIGFCFSGSEDEDEETDSEFIGMDSSGSGFICVEQYGPSMLFDDLSFVLSSENSKIVTEHKSPDMESPESKA